ncbi:MAG: hypothetical protein LC808_07415 [Actinobacteria bacterium]|nr:hypothetical protein [Actinomycetota bacterium]
MSTPRCTHLLCADEVLSEGYRYRGTYIAVCGEPIEASSLLITSCPDECDCEVAYCPGCLDAVNKRTWEAGVDVGCPPGITVVTGSRPGTRR